MNKLKQLEACGQSPWLDYLKRSLIEKGELRTLIERDGLKGVTSNPSIFEKAIGETDEYAEGFDILRNKDSKDLPDEERFALNIPDIAGVWRRGSVISSWLLDLGAAALVKDPQLKEFSGYVQDSGEGRWTVEAAIEEAVPADVLSTALYAGFRSRQEHNFGEKMFAAMRFGFGGHIEGNGSIDPEPKPKEPQRHSAAQNAAD